MIKGVCGRVESLTIGATLTHDGKTCTVKEIDATRPRQEPRIVCRCGGRFIMTDTGRLQRQEG